MSVQVFNTGKAFHILASFLSFVRKRAAILRCQNLWGTPQVANMSNCPVKKLRNDPPAHARRRGARPTCTAEFAIRGILPDGGEFLPMRAPTPGAFGSPLTLRGGGSGTRDGIFQEFV